MTFRKRVKLIFLFAGIAILCYPQNKLVNALNSVVSKIQNQNGLRDLSDKYLDETESGAGQGDSKSGNKRISHIISNSISFSEITDNVSSKTNHSYAKKSKSQSGKGDIRRIGTVAIEGEWQTSLIHPSQVATSSRTDSASSHLNIRTPQNSLVTTNYQHILLTGLAEIRLNTVFDIYVNDQILDANLIDLHDDGRFTAVILLETGENRIRVVYQHDDQMIEEVRTIKRNDNFRFGQHSLTLVGLENGLAVIDVVTRDIVGYIPTISVRKLLPFPDGIHVAIEYDGLFELFDARSGRFIAADLPGNGMELSRSYSDGYGYFYMNDNSLMAYDTHADKPISLRNLLGDNYSSLWVTESGNAWTANLNENGTYNLEGHTVLSDVDLLLSCGESTKEFRSDSVPIVTSSTNNNWIFYSRGFRSLGFLHAMQKDGDECVSWSISGALGKNPNNVVLDRKVDNLHGGQRVFSSSQGDIDPLFGGGKIRCFEYSPIKGKWRNIWVHGRNGIRQISLSNDGEWLSYAANDDNEIYYIRTESVGTARVEWSVFLGTAPVDMVHVFQTGLDDNIINLTISIEPIGAGTIEGDGDYEQGELVPITAVPEPGYRFVSWVGEGISDSGVTNTIVAMTEDRQIVAKFEAVPSSARSIVETGRETHIAIVGGGFFAVEYNGETGFTKTGDFFLKPDPENAGGYILSRPNGAILLGTQEAEGELAGPIRFSQFPESIDINALSGEVRATDHGVNIVENAFIQINTYDNEETLETIVDDIKSSSDLTTEKLVRFKNLSQGHIVSPENIEPKKYVDWYNDERENTGRQTHMALEGAAFFAVLFKDEIVYTRAGDFDFVEDMDMPGTFLLSRPNGAILLGSTIQDGEPVGQVRFNGPVQSFSIGSNTGNVSATDNNGNSIVENKFIGVYRFSHPDALIRIDDDISIDSSMGIYRKTTLANKISPSRTAIRQGMLTGSLSVSIDPDAWNQGPTEFTYMRTHLEIIGTGFFLVEFQGEHLLSRLGDFSLEEDPDLSGTFILRRPNGAILLGSDKENGNSIGRVRFFDMPSSFKVDQRRGNLIETDLNADGLVENMYIQTYRFMTPDALEEVEIGPYHCRKHGLFREVEFAGKINNSKSRIIQGLLEGCNIDIDKQVKRDLLRFRSTQKVEINNSGSIYFSVLYNGEILYAPLHGIYKFPLTEDPEKPGNYIISVVDGVTLLGTAEKNSGPLQPIRFSENPKSIRIDSISGEVKSYDYHGASIVENKYISIRHIPDSDQLIGLDYGLYRDLSSVENENNQSTQTSQTGDKLLKTVTNISVNWKGSIVAQILPNYVSNIAIIGNGFFTFKFLNEIIYSKRGDFSIIEIPNGKSSVFVLARPDGAILMGTDSASGNELTGPVTFNEVPSTVSIDSITGFVTGTGYELIVTNPYIIIFEFPDISNLVDIKIDPYRMSPLGLFYCPLEVTRTRTENLTIRQGAIERWNFDIANDLGNSRGKMYDINGISSKVSVLDYLYIPAIFQDEKVYSSGPDLLVVEDPDNSGQYLMCRPNGAILLGASATDELPTAPVRFVEKPNQVSINVTAQRIEATNIEGNNIVSNAYIDLFFDNHFSLHEGNESSVYGENPQSSLSIWNTGRHPTLYNTALSMSPLKYEVLTQQNYKSTFYETDQFYSVILEVFSYIDPLNIGEIRNLIAKLSNLSSVEDKLELINPGSPLSSYIDQCIAASLIGDMIKYLPYGSLVYGGTRVPYGYFYYVDTYGKGHLHVSADKNFVKEIETGIVKGIHITYREIILLVDDKKIIFAAKFPQKFTFTEPGGDTLFPWYVKK